MRNDPSQHSAKVLNSQQSLALSIARQVQLELPKGDSSEAIRVSVEEALETEACASELSLAYARSAIFMFATLVGLVAASTATAAGISEYPAGAWLLTLVAGLGAGGLAVALRTGKYRRWMRWAIPLADAIVISGWFLLLSAQLPSRQTPAAPVGIVAVGAILLAVSGALRLSRTSAILGTTFATLAWVVVAIAGAIPLLVTLPMALVIVVTGLLALRISRVIRRVITDEVARLRLTQMYEQAQEAIDAREEVLKIVSHDLRNPLSTISMAADMLLDYALPPEKQERHLQIIKRSGDRMNRMIRDLLDAARVSSGTLPIEPQRVSVPVLIDSVVELMGPLASEHSLELTVDLPANPPEIYVDSDRIVQVFSNLIGNAIKFTPAGGTITVGCAFEGLRARFSVSDTGPGIPPEQLTEIFQRMWQANKNDSRGIGLGLTIARAIIEAHGEEIGVESEVGVGTEFWFTATAIA